MDRTLSKTIASAGVGLMAISALFTPAPATAQSDPYLGQLMVFGGNFCPKGWAEAAGQLLSISQNTALFSLFGTYYGGDGRVTFALPNLRGTTPIGVGQGPGLADYAQGQTGGTEAVTIGVGNLPPHTHSITATNAAATKGGPGGKFLAAGATATSYPKYSESDAVPNVTMNGGMVGNTGGGQPISVRDPFLTQKWCIALQGVYPSRP